MGFLKAVRDFFQRVGAALGGAILAFLGAAAKSLAENGGTILTNAALAAVQAAEANGGNGKDKFQAAVETVIAQLERQAIPVALNAVHIAVEVAVANLKAKQS